MADLSGVVNENADEIDEIVQNAVDDSHDNALQEEAEQAAYEVMEDEGEKKKPKKPSPKLRTARILKSIQQWLLTDWGCPMRVYLAQEANERLPEYRWMFYKTAKRTINFVEINENKEVIEFSHDHLGDFIRDMADREVEAQLEDPHCCPVTRDISESIKSLNARLLSRLGHPVPSREIVEEILPIAFADDDRLCWKRLDLPMPDIRGVDPVNTYMGQFMENMRLIMADRQEGKENGFLRLLSWIGAVLSNDDLPIVMGLFGGGQNGKSKVVEMLQHKLGDLVRPEMDFDHLEGALGQMELKGRRVINIDEPKHGKVITHVVKRLTNPWVTARGLYQNFETFRNHSMFIFTSNHHFETDGSKAHNRRLVWCEMVELPDQLKMSLPELHADWDAHWPAIVTASIAAYKMCKGVLPMTDADLAEGADRFFVKQDAWIKKHLVYAPGAFLPKSTLVEMLGDRFSIGDVEKRLTILREEDQPLSVVGNQPERPAIEWCGQRGGIDRRVWIGNIDDRKGRTKETGWRHLGISTESYFCDKLKGRWIRWN